MKVELMTSREVLFSGEAAEVVMPSEDGEVSVWDFHQPCIVRLKAGKVSIRTRALMDNDKPGMNFPIIRGMARAGGQTLVVLAEDVR
jgi:F0F1-type ATP synthase epsilon subunit